MNYVPVVRGHLRVCARAHVCVCVCVCVEKHGGGRRGEAVGSTVPYLQLLMLHGYSYKALVCFI